MSAEQARVINVYLFTGNEGKHREVSRMFGEKINVIMAGDVRAAEIQGSGTEIIAQKLSDAHKQFMETHGTTTTHSPTTTNYILVEDTSLAISALGGFPGPYVKDFYTGLGCAGLCKLMRAFPDNKVATDICRVGLLNISSEKSLTLTTCRHGFITDVPRGDRGFGWDSVFEVDVKATRMTYAEMDDPVKDKWSARSCAMQELSVLVLE